jgi:hypothetical protein
MKVRLLLLLILAGAASLLNSQEIGHSAVMGNYRVETGMLGPDISFPQLRFDNAGLDDRFGMLPVYSYRFRLPDADRHVSVSIITKNESKFEHPDINGAADIDLVGTDYQMRTDIILIEGNPYAEIILLPIRSPDNNIINVLDSCLLQISVTEVASSRAPAGDFTFNSVLSTGKWYRLATRNYGMYQITYAQLEEMGIDPGSIDPATIRIFGNGNGVLPEINSVERYDDLLENAIYVHGEDDGSFDEGDYILFYGQAAVEWKYTSFGGFGYFEHNPNPYTDWTYYFLNFNDAPGRRVADVDNSGLTPTAFVTAFSDYAYHENDTVNILKTGREWYGEQFSDITSREYKFSFPNIVQDYKMSIKTSVVARSTQESNFYFYYGDEQVIDAGVPKIIPGTTIYAWTDSPDSTGVYPVLGDDITLRVEYNKPVSTSVGWMDYIAINARRELRFTPPSLSFRDHLSYGAGEIVQFTISSATDDLEVWDVTDPINATRQQGVSAGGSFTFNAPAEEIREYIAFDGSGFEQPEFIEEVKNQNLHSYEAVDYVVLTHPDFMDQAQRMLMLHQQFDGMSGFIVTPQEIYNEFSSGKQDPSAIRDFMRMLYDRIQGDPGSFYLLLLGDASYDYKDRVPDNTNYIPAYQSEESLKLGYSFVTDDFFGLLDPSEGSNAYGKSVDIGIGRFPVHNIEQAEAMVDKVEAYLTMKPQVLAPWRNDIYFVADDEDQNLHFNQAEKLQEMVDTGYKEFNRLKIYYDAFPQVSSSSGTKYPAVNEAIDRMVDGGALIVNYTGHGGEAGWSQEGTLNIPMINQWDNHDRLPLFITATCEFTRYDDPGLISAGEYVFLNPTGGGIGLLTTSRLAWADPNFRLNKAVYKFMFQRPGGEHYRIGDIVRLAKTDQNNGVNIKNFVLMGDPAMRLAYPECYVETTIIDGEKVRLIPDTLVSLSESKLEGILLDVNGDTLHDFNGLLFARIFDKDLKMSTLGNDYSSVPATFYAQGPTLFDGRATISDGQFELDLFMPENMNTDIGFGKVSYYAYDTTDHRDAYGYLKILVGGVDPNPPIDNSGPDLDLFMNNTDFVSGGLTDSEPVFLARLFDEHGISFTGNGIGRDITLILDGDPSTSVVLNDIYSPDIDTYKSGWVSYPLSGLEDGKHSLTLKAWDNMNNASEATIEFEVNVDGPLALSGVMNYPNPFSNLTYFVFDHNKPGNRFDVEISIFNLQGQLVQTLRTSNAADGLSIGPVAWDGTDSRGNVLSRGMYIYRLFVTDEQGAQYVQTSKLLFTGKQ